MQLYTGPKYLTITKGINLFGNCENKSCVTYNKEVIERIYDNEFDMIKQQGTMKCPMCNCLCKVNTVGFYNFYYNVLEVNMMKK